MTNHPRRSRARLARYGARLRTIDGQIVVEMRFPNDRARVIYQYRRSADGAGVEVRTLSSDGSPFSDTGSPWEAVNVTVMRAERGRYHPILDPLGM